MGECNDSVAVTLSPDLVVVFEMSSKMTAREVSGLALQLMEMKENS